MHTDGLNPVAQFDENYGDLYQTLDHLARSLKTDDYVIASVVHGDTYLCIPADGDDNPYWELTAEIGPGQTGAWDSATDKASNGFPEEYKLIDILGSDERYLVYVSDE